MSVHASSIDVAIVGMSAMFAGAPDLQTYWHNILAGTDGVREASDRWSVPYFDPSSTDNARIYTRKGGFLGDEVDFDPIEFGVMPNTVPCADPDHFLALKLARAALRDAGYESRSFDRKRTGLIFGRGTYVNRGYNTLLQHGQVVDQVLSLLASLRPDLSEQMLEKIRARLKESLPAFTGDVVPSLVPNVITGRIANRLDLMGPNYIVDAACASSLIAVDLAITELTSGRCDMVLSGGVHSTTPPQLYMMFCQLGALSRADLRPFDTAADGTLLGEGIGIVVLKRLADADRDKDRIYAVIKGTGTSSDGRAVGLLAPNLEGQILALKRAYAQSGIDPDTIDLIEAHGTGMPVGDKTEVNTLRTVFGNRAPDGLPRRALGSVKSMIGHCIPAAGIAGLIKVALALHDKVLPATLCNTVNPALELGRTSFYVNTESRPWIHEGRSHKRRAGVNAFGFGGINAHAVLEEYIAPDHVERLVHSRWPAELLLFAAPDRHALVESLRRVQDLIAPGTKPPLSDIAYTMRHPGEGSHRLAIISATAEDLERKISKAIDVLSGSAKPPVSGRRDLIYGVVEEISHSGDIAMLFPGEGGQYPNMLADLCMHVPAVRKWFERLDASLAKLAPVPPSQIIFPPPSTLEERTRRALEEQLKSLEIGSAAVFVASMAIYEFLVELGVRCDAMVGHSTGEGTALVASGLVRISDELQLQSKLASFNRTYRELIGAGRVPRGALLTVGAIPKAELDEAVATFGGRLHIALENCPNQTVLFGTADDVKTISEKLIASGAICMPLSFDRAYHTPLFAESEPILRALYESLDVGPGHTPVYSCATTRPIPDDPEAIRELATRQWFSRVRFSETIESLYANGIRTFLEVGPGSNVTGFVRDILHGRDHLALATNVPGKSSVTQVLNVLAQLFIRGVALNLEPLFTSRPVNMLSRDQTVDQRQPAPPRINLNMPVMRLPEEFIAEVQPALPAEQTPPPAGRDTKLAGLIAHFDLMQEFLASQGRIMSQIGGSVRLAQSKTSEGPAAQQAGPAVLSVAERWPLLGTILEQDADHLLCERQVSIDRDTFLRDHTLGNQPSDRQTNLHALPIVPFTISMEIVAEAAHCLASGNRSVVRLHDLRGYRWLALDEGAISILISARRPSDRSWLGIQVQIFEIRKGKEGEERQLVFEGRVDLGESFPTAPAQKPFLLSQPQNPHYSPEMLYGAGAVGEGRYAPLFHGPAFQGVRKIRLWSREGIEADMRASDGTKLFRNLGKPSMQTDAVLLDCAGQLIGYWVAERFGVDLSFFPFAVRELRQYGPPPRAGANILCRGTVRIVDDADEPGGFEFVARDGTVLLRVGNDSEPPSHIPTVYETCRIYPQSARIEGAFEFLDSDGRVLAQIAGWQDHYFSISHRYYRARLWPQREYLSQPWMESEAGFFCRRIDSEAMPFLEQGWGIWKRVLAHLMLSERERGLWYNLPTQGRRRSEWLMGRIAAKDAVRMWAEEHFRLSLAPADVEVLTGKFGEPEIHCAPLRNLGATPIVSISHSGGWIVAAASDASARIGIDLVRLQDVRSIDAVKKAFGDDELKFLPGLGQQEGLSVLSLWAAREAAAKALGTGLKGEPRDWIIDDCQADGRHITVKHENESYHVTIWSTPDEVVAVCYAGAMRSNGAWHLQTT
ncbi:MAG TPA: beta-ketoacyl synthase N-terminal-like domain-containing protein [Terriglobia bacterium]|nr:beta-ketoacyl synthase N-terminal-like domain-containing protein [Terriglobia bacterium]